jgi:predicted transcriptional regulator
MPMTTETTKTESNLKPFLVRLRPDTRALLDDAAEQERRSRASIIDEALRNHLAGYQRVQDRLDAFLGTKTP